MFILKMRGREGRRDEGMERRRDEEERWREGEMERGEGATQQAEAKAGSVLVQAPGDQ